MVYQRAYARLQCEFMVDAILRWAMRFAFREIDNLFAHRSWRHEPPWCLLATATPCDEYFITISRFMPSKLGLSRVIENHHASAPSEPEMSSCTEFLITCVSYAVCLSHRHARAHGVPDNDSCTHTHPALTLSPNTSNFVIMIIQCICRDCRRWMLLGAAEMDLLKCFVIYRLNVEDTRTAPSPALHITQHH